MQEPDGSDSEEEYIGPVHTNRGNKLKRSASQVYRGRLNGPLFDGHGVKIVEYEPGKKRAVVYKKRRVDAKDNGDDDDDDDNDISDEQDDIYEDIKLRDLLAPISDPAQLPTHPAISHTYKSPVLRTLSNRAMTIITEEHKNVVRFSKMMRLFLGEDPKYILPKSLNLPAYDHVNANGAIVDEAPKEEIDDRPRTRNQSTQEVDPFFALPQYSVDPDFGLSRESADETRQFVQIALQRSEEFIRCMTRVRMGLLRAQRLKDQVYSWCKEMADEDESLEANGSANGSANPTEGNGTLTNETTN